MAFFYVFGSDKGSHSGNKFFEPEVEQLLDLSW